MCDVCVVYNSDVEQWAEYLMDRLRKEWHFQVKITGEESLATSEESRGVVSTAKFLVVIASPGFFRSIENELRVTFVGLVSDPKKTLLLLCGSETVQFYELDRSGRTFDKRFPNFVKWTKFDHKDCENALAFVARSLQESSSGKIQTDLGTNSSVSGGNDEGDEVQHTGGCDEGEEEEEEEDGEDGEDDDDYVPSDNIPRRRSKNLSKTYSFEKSDDTYGDYGLAADVPSWGTNDEIKFQIIPTEVRSEGTTAVVVALEEPLQLDNTEKSAIKIAFAENGMKRKFEVKWLNSTTFYFNTPCRTPGVVEVQILKKDRQIGCSKQLTFSPVQSDAVAAVVEISQIYIHLIRILFDFLSSRRLLGPEVDKLLANVFRDGGDSDQINNVRGFEQFFGAYSNPDQETNDVKLPTFLHLAAMFGLKELGSALLDLPDVRFATGIRNAMKKLPSELARDNGYDEMANNIEKFSEENDGDEDLYLPMQKKATDDDMYLPMHCRGGGANVIPELLVSRIASLSGTDSPVETEEKHFFPERAGSLDRADENGNGERDGVKVGSEDVPRDTVDPIDSFTKCEAELIRIMDQVKKGAISQEDALMLYQACELNHGREDSKLKKKKDNLEKIKEDGKHTGLKQMLSKLLGGRKSPSNLEMAYSSAGRRPSNAQVPSLPPEKKQVRTLPAPKKRYLNEMADDDYDVVVRRASSGARIDSNPTRHPTYDSNQRAPAVPPRPDIDSGEEDTRSKVPPPPYRVESNSKSHPDDNDDDEGDRSDGYLPLYDTNDDHPVGEDEGGYYTCVSERKSSKEDIKKRQGGRGDAPEPPPPRNPPPLRRRNVGPTQLSVPERLNPPIPYNQPRKCSLPENMYSSSRRPVPVPGSGKGKVSALGRGGNSAESMFSVVEENG